MDEMRPISRGKGSQPRPGESCLVGLLSGAAQNNRATRRSPQSHLSGAKSCVCSFSHCNLIALVKIRLFPQGPMYQMLVSLEWPY